MKELTNELKLIELTNEGLTNKEISSLLGVSRSTIVRQKQLYGIRSKYSVFKNENKKCLQCNIDFNCLKSENRKFCSQNCSAVYTNIKRGENNLLKNSDIIKICENCNNDFKINSRNFSKHKFRKFCSTKCHTEYEEKIKFEYVENNKSVSSRVVKVYLIKKYGEKCMECGWCENNKTSNKIPIELEHIDGNSENNNLDNLKLLCPNCHSLTPTYKALNRGNGRHKRMERYNENKSY